MPAPNVKLINAKMNSLMGDIDAIKKDQTNEQQKFKYRGIDDLYNALHGLFAKHGIFCTTEVLGQERQERTTRSGGVLAFTKLHLRYHFHAEDGTSIATEVIGEGMDSGDKSSNKAMAVGHKYALLQAFLIPTDEVKDPDAEVHEITDAQPDAKYIEKLETAAAQGAAAFRHAWRYVPKAQRELIPEEMLLIWKEVAGETDRHAEADNAE